MAELGLIDSDSSDDDEVLYAEEPATEVARLHPVDSPQDVATVPLSRDGLFDTDSDDDSPVRVVAVSKPDPVTGAFCLTLESHRAPFTHQTHQLDRAYAVTTRTSTAGVQIEDIVSDEDNNEDERKPAAKEAAANSPTERASSNTNSPTERTEAPPSPDPSEDSVRVLRDEEVTLLNKTDQQKRALLQELNRQFATEPSVQLENETTPHQKRRNHRPDRQPTPPGQHQGRRASSKTRTRPRPTTGRHDARRRRRRFIGYRRNNSEQRTSKEERC